MPKDFLVYDKIDCKVMMQIDLFYRKRRHFLSFFGTHTSVRNYTISTMLFTQPIQLKHSAG